MENYGKNVKKRIWKTKGSRFNANKRLLVKHHFSKITIGFLSGYVIIINIYGMYSKISSAEINITMIPLITAGLGIMILVFSQIESSKNYRLEAEKHHLCGKEISRLYNQIEVILATVNEQTALRDSINKINEEYYKVLNKYENHDPLDYDLFRANHRKFFELSTLFSSWIKFKAYVTPRLLYWFLMFSPWLLLGYVYF